MLRLYDNRLSGNGYKPRLLLAHLGRTYERIEVDILKGETRTPEFLAINPNGRIPVLVLEDGTRLAESNAILFFLAEGSRSSPPAGWPAPSAYSGCSSSNTVTSPASRWRATGFSMSR